MGDVIRVPEPVMSNDELSECVGRLTCELDVLRREVAVMKNGGKPSLKQRLRAWLISKLSE